MVAANLGGLVLMEPHPFWFRIYGTFAAPLFIMVSGMMVAHTAAATDRKLKYYLIRGGMVIAAGALLDIVVWQIYPFISMDVLYLIGISLPIAYLTARFASVYQCGIALAIVLVSPLLQHVLGYTDYPAEISLLREVTRASNHTSILNHWLVDGWFPIFPWTAFAILGSAVGRWRVREDNDTKFAAPRWAVPSLAILAAGMLLWWLYPGALLTRNGYSELFYPPTVGYAITSVGVALLAFSIVDLKPGLRIYAPVQALGEASLFMYLFHLAVGEYIILLIWPSNEMLPFCVIYAVLMIIMIGAAYGLRRVRARWRSRPLLVRFLIG